MKARLITFASLLLGAFCLPATDVTNRQADRELLGKLHAAVVPRLEVREVHVERAIQRYLELLAAEWKTPKPMPYRVERRMPAEPNIVTISFSERPFVDGLREAIGLAGWSFTVRDGVLVFSNSKDLYQDEIWQLPILLPK